jgi:hypothetical protein
MTYGFSFTGIFPEGGNEQLRGSHQISAGEHTLEVVPEGKDHNADQKDQPHLLGKFPLPFAKRLPEYALD